MLRFHLAALIMAAATAVFAQSSGQSPLAPPEVKENPKPKPGEETGTVGTKPFTLTTADDGEVNYSFNEKNEPESLVARKGVIFSSDDMTLNADQLEYRNATSELVANGKRVVVRQGEYIATCQLFKYTANDQRSELSGNPVVYNRTSDGKTQAITGARIELATVNGKTKMSIRGENGKPPILSSGKPAPAITNQGAHVIVSDKGVAGAAAPTTAPSAASGPGSAAAGIGSVFGGNSTDKPAQPKPNRIDTASSADVRSYTANGR